MDHPMYAYPQYPQQASGAQYPNQYPAQYPTQNAAQGQGQYPQQPMGYPAGYPAAYPMYAPQAQQQQSSNLLGFANERFFKGLLIGAAAAYLLTNENVQRTAIKSAVKAWSLLQGGVEEIKERFHDAEAEIRAESSE